ncbi:hypothetical protein [uncultured Ornithinimicrobium sp.]|uniref:hypothetical protein n=1 Tax=uncultured Ornithinimicrobium sp. TaxID=259307 RepID=UPI00259993CF|nr:hypothetical protein [uncultured Ornithinimicrobium sp.]
MTVRPCLVSDLPVDGAPWMEPDADLGESRSLVEEVDGEVVAAGLRRRGAPDDDVDLVELACRPGRGADLLKALVAEDDRPVMLRVVPGTPKAEAVAVVGHVEVMQSLPPGAIPTDHPDVLAWSHEGLSAAELERLTLTPATDFTVEQLLDLWMVAYVPAHEGFLPVKDADATREKFRRWFAERLDRESSFVARDGDGHVVAATMMTAEIDGVLVPSLVEVWPGHPVAETAASACVAATVLAVSPRPVEFEGHVDQALYMSVMEMVPHRSAGVLTPMDMVRIQGVEGASVSRSGQTE